MTDQLIVGFAVVFVALLIAYEVVETWRWQGFANRPPSRFRIIRGIRRAIAGLVSIVTLRRWRRPPVEPFVALDEDDLARRLGDAPTGPVHLRPGRIVVSGARVPPPQPLQPVVPVPALRAERPSRLRLARDMTGAALVMGGFVVVFANLMPATNPITGPIATGGVNAATGTPAPSLEIRIATPAVAEPSPLSEASIVPAPVPSGTGLVSAVPSPTPTGAPTPRRTQAPPPAYVPPAATPAPTPKPTPKPTKKPTPTPKPAANISSFDAAPPSAGVGESVTFSYQYTHGTSCSISFSDGSGPQPCPLSGGSDSLSHAFDSADTYNVVLEIGGPGGPDTKTVTVVVN